MPRPRNSPHIFDQLKFVTNYLLAGCGPAPDLIFELNDDAAKNLLLLFVGLDAQDIVQGMFDPRHKRARSPGRHGRKSGRGIGFPDISDEIGKRVSVPEIGRGLQKLPLGRWVLPGINVIEGITISAAVIEGLSDVVFDNLAGLLDLNPNYCREFERFRRRVCYAPECPDVGYDGPPIVGFPGPTYDPIPMKKLLGNSGFTTNIFSARSETTAWGLATEITVMGHTSGFPSSGRLTIHTDQRGEIATSHHVSIDKGEITSFTLDAVINPWEYATVSWAATQGYMLVLDGQVAGYGKSGWLDWL